MYFKDLTPYTFLAVRDGVAPLNVGWIEPWRFRRWGFVSRAFVDRLFAACRRPVAATRGFHVCGLCHAGGATGLVVKRDGVELRLGSAEIRVAGKDARVYAAPNLIYHYVVRHRYRPPREFIDAVLALPPEATAP